MPLAYQELRKLAVAKLSLESFWQTLQVTERVHETWPRLAGSEVVIRWQG